MTPSTAKRAAWCLIFPTRTIEERDRSARGDALNVGAQGVEALVDAFVAALDLLGILDDARSLGAKRSDQHGHAGADVGAFHAGTAQSCRTGDDDPMRIAQHDSRAHRDELVDEEHAAFEHLLEEQDHASHCVAVTMAIDMASAGKAGHG